MANPVTRNSEADTPRSPPGACLARCPGAGTCRWGPEHVSDDLDGWMVEGVTMVDPEPEAVPSRDIGLVRQKHVGFLERDNDFKDQFNRHSRLYHRARFGAYSPGRHHSHLPRIGHGDTNANVLWYVFSPWQPEFIQRKLQISGRIPERDRKAGFGFQHSYPQQHLEHLRQSLLPYAIDLAGLPSLRSTDGVEA